MRLSEDQFIFVNKLLFDYLDCREKAIKENRLGDYIQKKNEIIEETDKTGFETELEQLNERTKIGNEEEDGSNNNSKNRYLTIFPCEHSRVRLSVNVDLYDTDFIDANFIDNYFLNDNFIATRAPLMKTITEFWRMVWEYGCCTIVMLMVDEVFVYWPRLSSLPLTLKHFFIEIVEESTYNDYILRQFRITNTKEGTSRLVYHFHYNCWPAEGTAISPFGLTDLAEQVKEWNAENGNAPIVVHCSDGVGRSGVFIAIYNIIERLSEEHTINIYQTINLMRKQRPDMVRTEADYRLCYRAIKEHLDALQM